MDNRQRLLEAAGRVYAEVGFRGATTRRIAEEAGVNEVTLFRLFGSKAQLIAEAIRCIEPLTRSPLPETPVNPLRELTEWCSGVTKVLRESRAVIRKTMAELEEHPEMVPHVCNGQATHHNELVAYATKVAVAGTVGDAEDVRTACTMLFAAVFSDAMGREIAPMVYPQPESEAAGRYARAFLRALGLSTIDRVAAPPRLAALPSASAPRSTIPATQST